MSRMKKGKETEKGRKMERAALEETRDGRKNGMTLRELRDRIDEVLDENPEAGDREVAVKVMQRVKDRRCRDAYRLVRQYAKLDMLALSLHPLNVESVVFDDVREAEDNRYMMLRANVISEKE